MLLFSRGREWEGTSPYGDPCRPEQLNALSLFCSLLVVLATELAHRERNRKRVRERERDREIAGSQQHYAVFAMVVPRAPFHVHVNFGNSTFVVFSQTLWRRNSSGSEGPLKRDKDNLRILGEKQEK